MDTSEEVYLPISVENPTAIAYLVKIGLDRLNYNSPKHLSKKGFKLLS